MNLLVKLSESLFRNFALKKLFEDILLWWKHHFWWSSSARLLSLLWNRSIGQYNVPTFVRVLNRRLVCECLCGLWSLNEAVYVLKHIRLNSKLGVLLQASHCLEVFILFDSTDLLPWLAFILEMIIHYHLNLFSNLTLLMILRSILYRSVRLNLMGIIKMLLVLLLLLLLNVVIDLN